jgi:peptidyl-prolyl cis-trans isomerase SurA
MKKILLALSASLLSLMVYTQENKSVLMTIDGRDITTEEFLRVYSKNSNITPEAEKKSMDEYLDLFINFKLKVIEAENLGYDTVKSFITELGSYKKQLAQPYLLVSEAQDKAIEEAYYRTVNEVRASHIMVRLSPTAAPADTLMAYNKIMAWRNRIVAGEPFEVVFKESIVDPREAEGNGDLGYFSAFRMVYPFEKVAFSTPVGQISMPVRTQYGYHLIKVTDFRPNRGSVKVSHIFTRFTPDAPAPEKQAALEKIQKALEELKSGADWNDVVQKYSENPHTKKINGDVGWLKTGKAPDYFLDYCFNLEPGQISDIIETPGGYHIIKLFEKIPVESYDAIKAELKTKIESDAERRNAVQKTADNNLKNKYEFVLNRDIALPLINVLDSNIYKQMWNASAAKNLTQTIVTLGNKHYTQYDYAVYLSKANKMATMKKSFENIIKDNLDEFANECLQNYAMENLEVENLDYKYLTKEYHDGILLFNLTNDTIWKRAQDDSAGLEAFYLTSEKYSWNPRVATKIYEYTDSSYTAKLPSLVKKQLKSKKGNDYILEGLCPNDTVPCVTFKEKTYEKNIDAFADKLTWKKGSSLSIKDNNKFFFYYVTNTLPMETKKLNEARGLYIADYQNYLEKEWIKELRKKYPVKINDTVYNEIKANLNNQK